MSKSYDLYPASERKIDNWRRRILGYEKMKRDLQRQIQILRNKNKKQKEVMDNVINIINQHFKHHPELLTENQIEYELIRKIENILKEVSK